MSKTPGPKSIYLLAGGRGSRRSDNDPLLTRVLVSCGVPSPSIAYVGAASGDDRPFFKMLSGYLVDCGAGQVVLAPLAGRWVKPKKTQAILESADMILISGGDVEAGMEVLEERKILPFFHDLHAGGKPFFGISAGSIMLAKQWVLWGDPDDDATASAFPCMGLASVICDTHGETERWEELRTLVRLSEEGTRGYGIPMGAGLCVHPDGTLEALGAPVSCFASRGGSVVRDADLPAQ
jgi:peptidase E